MAIKTRIQKKKFLKELHQANNIDLSREKLLELLDHENALETKNPSMYDFETSVNTQFYENHPKSDATYTGKELEEVTAFPGLEKKDFTLNEDDFLKKVKENKKYKGLGFTFKTARVGQDAIRITNAEGKSEVITLDTRKSYGTKGAEVIWKDNYAFEKFTAFIEGAKYDKEKVSIFKDTGLEEDEYYELDIPSGSAIERARLLKKKPPTKEQKKTNMLNLVEKVKQITKRVVTNPGKYIDGLPSHKHDTSYLETGNYDDLIKDKIHSVVVEKTQKALGGNVSKNSILKILDTYNPKTDNSMFERILGAKVQQEKTLRNIESLRTSSVLDEEFKEQENNLHFNTKTDRQKIKIGLNREIGVENKKINGWLEELNNENDVDNQKLIIAKIDESKEKIKLLDQKIIDNAITVKQVQTVGGVPEYKKVTDESLASRFSQSFTNDPDGEKIAFNAATGLLDTKETWMAKIALEHDTSRIESIQHMRDMKLGEYKNLLISSTDKIITVDLKSLQTATHSPSSLHAEQAKILFDKINNNLTDQQKEQFDKTGKVELSYYDINHKDGMNLDYRDFEGSWFKKAPKINKEDLEWMKMQKHAMDINHGERSVLYDLTELDLDPSSIDKPGFIANTVQVAIQETFYDIFNYTRPEAANIATLGAGRRTREIYDIITSVKDQYNTLGTQNNWEINGIKFDPWVMNEKQQNKMAKKFWEEVSEGTGHFAPILLKIPVFAGLAGGALQIAGLGKSLSLMRKSKNVYKRMQAHWWSIIKEEAVFTAAGMPIFTATPFYAIGQSTQGLSPFKTKFKMFDPIFQKVIKGAMAGATASEIASITDVTYKHLMGNKDFKAEFDKLYGDMDEVGKRMTISLMNFAMVGGLHLNKKDMPWERSLGALSHYNAGMQSRMKDVMNRYEIESKELKGETGVEFNVLYPTGPLGNTKNLFKEGKAPEKYQSEYDTHKRFLELGQSLLVKETNAYEIHHTNPKFEVNVQKRLLDPFNKALGKVIGEKFEPIKMKWITDKNELGKGNSAEYNPDTNTISANKKTFNPGEFNHEIFHGMFSQYFKANPHLQMNFTKSAATKFAKFDLEITDKAGKVWKIKDFIKEHYGDGGKVMDLRSPEARVQFNNEFLSYMVQSLTNPLVNKQKNAPNFLYELKDEFKSLLESWGMKMDASTPESMLNAIARLGRDTGYSRVSSTQLESMLKGFEDMGIIMNNSKIKPASYYSQKKFYAKDTKQINKELNEFFASEYNKLDWGKLTRDQKKDFGEYIGIYYENRIRGIIKNMYPDLKQHQIENIATRFVNRDSKNGWVDMIASFDHKKNDDITGWPYDRNNMKKYHRFVKEETKDVAILDKPVSFSGESTVTLGEKLEAKGDKTGKDFDIADSPFEENLVDIRPQLNPKELIKVKKEVKELEFDYNNPKSMARILSPVLLKYSKGVFNVTAEKGNAYSKADVNNVLKKLKEEVEHDGKMITVGELIFEGMPLSNVNPQTGKAMGVGEIMQRFLYGDVLGRASAKGVEMSEQGTGGKIRKTWKEIGGIEGIEKIFDRLMVEGKRGDLSFAKAWVEQFNKLLGNTLAREKATTENAKAEVLQEMAGGYTNLAAKEIKNEWNKIPGMTEGMVQYYIGEYAKDPNKFKADYPLEKLNMVQNILEAAAYNKLIGGKANAAHYNVSEIIFRKKEFENGDIVTEKELKDVAEGIAYISTKSVKDGKKIQKIDKKAAEEYYKMAQSFARNLPLEFANKRFWGFSQLLLGMKDNTTGEVHSMDTKTFKKMVDKYTGESFKKIYSWQNTTKAIVKNLGKNKKAQELYKNLTLKDFKQLHTLRKAYKEIIKLREEGKIEEANKKLGETFSIENENVKRELYYQFNSAKQLWLEDAPTKKEYLRRARHILMMGKLQDSIVGGERALVPIRAVFLPGGPVDGVDKLEHVQSMVERSLETARAIFEGRFIKDGREMIKGFKGILGEKNAFDIVDLIGGKTNVSGMARLTAQMEKLTDYYTIGEKGVTNVTLYDQLMHTTAQSLGRMGRELTQPYIKDMFYKYAASKTESDKIILEKAIKDPKFAKIYARHVQAVIKSGLHADKNMSTSQLAELLNLKTKATRIYLDPNAKKKGGSVYDLDRTLYEGVEKVTVTMPSGKKLKLNSEEFAREYDTLQKEGGEFDYSQFDKMFGNKKGPLFKHLLKQQEQHGSEHLYILTARAPGATKAIHEWLKRNGVDMPIDNIVTLQDGRPEAKSNWFIGKIVEKNYNDLFFADDIKANVNAVGKVLDKLNINSKLREVNAQAAKNLSSDWNRMIEETTGVEAFKVISPATARKSGKDIGKWRWWLPSGAQHFLTLNYKFFGKGKQGDKHREWFDKVLAEPYAKGNYQLNIERARLRDDYKALLKDNKNVKKILKKDTGYRGYTFEHAARVYLWDSFGINMEKHGLTKTDTKKLIQMVKSNPELQAFADQLPSIANIKEGYIAPNKHWVDEGIAHDIRSIGGNIYRKEFLKTWVDNKNKIYTPENLNKIEKIYGTRYREALEDILYRMEYDTSKSFGKDRNTNSLSKWISNATATVMFLNRRSALTQTISSLNFIEATGPNNILAATGAFAKNPNQYWKDFAMIFNSPMLKQRRLGNKLDVNYAELINTMKDKKDPITAASAWMLEKGFIFTKSADSFAISFGGAGYYRNYVNHYLKKGMSKVEAEKAAFLKFQEASEPTQQSTRPDLISRQQASNIGRFVLNFQNVSIQNNNNMYRGILDVVNGRGDMKTNISKIIYYGAVQNVMFLGLQQAVFSAYFDPEDTEEKQQAKVNDKMIGVGNGMADILLRGSGVTGAMLATLKNALIKYVDETQKGYKGDQAKVLIEALNFSPPIGSKSRKFYNALQDDKFSKETTIQPPLLAAEAVTNIPFNEFYEMVEDGVLLSNQELENWQRLAIILGYRPWQVGIDDQEDDKKETRGEIQMSDIEISDVEMSDIKIN